MIVFWCNLETEAINTVKAEDGLLEQYIRYLISKYEIISSQFDVDLVLNTRPASHFGQQSSKIFRCPARGLSGCPVWVTRPCMGPSEAKQLYHTSALSVLVFQNWDASRFLLQNMIPEMHIFGFWSCSHVAVMIS